MSAPTPPSSPPSRTRTLLAAASARLTWAELSGAVGDLGTFLPLTLGLVAGANLDLGTTLLFTGAYNIILGCAFDLPLPVQPMKTIAAVGATGAVSLPAIMAAGLFVGGCVVLLGVTRAVDAVNALIPRCVVRGLQLGVGLKLASTGVAKALLKSSKPLTLRPLSGSNGAAAGAATLLFLVAASAARPGDDPADAPDPAAAPLLPTRLRAAWRWRRRRGGEEEGSGDRAAGDGGGSSHTSATAATDAVLPPSSSPSPSPLRIPAALVVVAIGVVVAIVRAPPAARAALRFGPSRVTPAAPSRADWIAGITTAGGAAQLPLTTLNSVVAVSALADSLYGPSRRHTPARVAVAVGAMNLFGCWFQVMPACSGSGGLAAQHRFGARTGGAPVILGAIKIGVALLFGSSLASILTHFPDAMLGGLLACAGAELAASARREGGPRGFGFAALTAAAILATDDAGAGFLIGYVCYVATVAWEAVGGVVAKAAAACRGRGKRAGGGV